ncbi:MAG: hypothetical protein AAGN82_31905 [Myxococcota bacterium]
MTYRGYRWWMPILALLTGCGDADDEAPSADPGPAACTVDVAAERSLVEGGTAVLPLSLAGPVSDLTPVPDGFSGRLNLEGDATLRLRPDYGTGDTTQTLALSYDCDGRQASVDLSFAVRRITWRALPTWIEGDTGPLNREYGALWVAPDDPDGMFAFGGFHYRPTQFTPANELWRFDLSSEAWAQLGAEEAPLRPGAGLALADGVPFLFGGLEGNTTPSSLFRLDGLDGSGAAFSEVALDHAGGDAVGDYQPSFVFDAPRGRFVTACGANTAWGDHCRVRVIDPATGAVTEAEVDGPRPEGRSGQFWIHDEAEARLIIFGGYAGAGATDGTFFGDTWALELAERPLRWVQLDDGTADGAPEGRRNGVYVYDPDGRRFFMWGGTPDGMSASLGLFAFDLERGQEGWVQVETGGDEAPPPRSSGHGVYDAARRQIVLGFGNSNQGVFADLWALSL